MKNKKNKVLIIIILLLFLLGIGGYFIYDMVFVNFNNNDTFSMDTNSGRVIVTGYVTSEIIQENLYDVGYEYIYFNILKSNSQNFLTYIENSKG